VDTPSRVGHDVAIVSSAVVPVGRYHDELEHEMLLRPFVEAWGAIELDRSEIGAVVLANPRPYAAQRYFATFITAYLGLPVDGVVVEVLGNGMTGGLALDAAADQIRLGRARAALVLGVSRETHVPSAEHMDLVMRSVGDVDFHTPLGVTPVAWYALNATRYLSDYGYTRTDLAAIAVKNRMHASLNPIAQYGAPLTIEEVLDARPVARPLHLYDVPPRSDGAVAMVLAEATLAEQIVAQPVHLVGRGFHHEGVHQIADVPASLTRYIAAERAAEIAYADAGIGPDQIDVAEVYAPCTVVEAILSESLGLFREGEGLRAATRGETSLGGRIPISTDGGCLSRGHPPMVTPLYNVHEARLQLCGQADQRQVHDAEIALTTCELGDYNAALVHVLATRRRGEAGGGNGWRLASADPHT
jgi:acetyl-CoA C-acetyltransferase